MSTHLSPYLRRREVVSWIEPLGSGLVDQFVKLVDAGTIQSIHLGAGCRAYYLRAEIEAHLLKPFHDAERRLAGGANAHT